MSAAEPTPELAFIGAGNMAHALIRGLLDNGIAPAHIHVADPLESQLASLAQYGVHTYTDNNAALAHANLAMLAIKPQVAGEVVQALTALHSDQLLISIAAGINIDSLQAWTSPTQPIVRCMPNTPALLGAGMTALYANSACSKPQQQLAEQVLRAAGETLWVATERELDAVTAVSGSGPAYFFLLMEAMVEAGTQLGLSRDTATRLTLQTAYGAALMAHNSDDPPDVLRTNVTSPGGTTAAALAVLEAHNMQNIIGDALSAAERRAAELAEEFGS